MHWIGKSWDKEDVEFAPKRKVDNKDSKARHHVIGAFHSHKMHMVAEYEARTEWAFYSLLELERSTVRYYVQPVRIPVPFRDDNGVLKSWVHVPDVLVFREGAVFGRLPPRRYRLCKCIGRQGTYMGGVSLNFSISWHRQMFKCICTLNVPAKTDEIKALRTNGTVWLLRN